ncbi:putative endoribonuclease L-PSP [Serratia quinivorans]|jgi:enamine deaminase RidA (YjgF/YER057c/UK114 family)|uniref:RidA family protein n=1 Tax=Serratia TaxID=613 RepID=UPI0010764408|nr:MULTISPECIES: RidA family protein [Serratia]TFZ50282.1 RidA family protein [Serratia proteamaculans]CAI0730100.1 putative endoribonuclease L-PSP [Serratia quinivorans]CAI0773883.1 putative endoribonuclease L-PSP [Serratia quinivorans]CAI0774514.1 putative endoribonuclease L-PSP [Serratia quinivorans]CAI0779888.1 putative endoribonuclease L-PSP [Serratia quinivorans]
MNIERIDPADRWSEAVVHNDTVYYTSVPENLDDDATAQTANALAAIDMILTRVGSDKSRVLDATIFLADGADFAAMNAAWDAWVVAGSAPVRCTVQAKLMNPKYKVEIKIIAAL